MSLLNTFLAWMQGLCVCLLYQLAEVIVELALIDTKSGRLSGLFLALIYTIIGIPGAWMIWCAALPPRKSRPPCTSG